MRKNRLRFACAPILFGCVFWGGALVFAQNQPAAPVVYGGLSLHNASLTEVVDMLARQLKINYVIDPQVKGSVILNTYGETRNLDTRSLLEMILRLNGAGMVKEGDIYHIVPLAQISHHPLPIEQKDAHAIDPTEEEMLNLVFLKYATADELVTVLKPFAGEYADILSYAPANLVFIMDSARNMKRLMELVSLFDNDTLAHQRVRLFEVQNGRPSDLVKELDTIFKSISLSAKKAPITFLPIDRISTIIAVAPNPGVFAEVKQWIDKLDIPVKVTPGSSNNYVYRVRYGDAVMLSAAIKALYSGQDLSAFIGAGMGGFGMMGGYGGGGFGGGAFGRFGGGGYGGYGGYGGGYGGYGGYGGGYGGYGGGMLPTTPGNLGLRFGGSNAFNPASRPLTNAVGQPINPAPATGAVPSTDQTGQYLQPGAAGAEAAYNGPHIIGNPFDNTLLIQATPDEYAGILKLLDQLDVPPRQVLIEAKVYEVDLTGNLSSGVTAYLQQKSGANKQFLGSLVGNATNLSVGMLVGETRELLAAVQVLSSNSKARVISAPSLIATDSMPATMNVGITVPVLTSTAAVPGLTSNNGLVFANSVAEQDSGVTLNMLARVNSSGIVTMLIDQEVSTPQASQFGVSTSPQFQKRSVTTQVTCQDGDTVAIGGIIQETNQFSTSGLPLLNRIPVLGAAFGSRSYNKTRTELIIFLTPRVIYDTNQLVDATDELRDRLKQAGKLMQ